ncbi:MAG: hypothetical protein WC725_04880 [Patescibacteria group bacterium]|jgi:hypothetical protein
MNDLLEDCKKVTSEEFYENLKATATAGRDIMPRIINDRVPYIEEWKDKRDRKTFGYTFGAEYFLVK